MGYTQVMSKNNIVITWIEALGNETIQESLNVLNKKLKTKYNLSRLGDWRRGYRPIPPKVYRLMLEQAIQHAIEKHGGTMPKVKLKALIRSLLPPNK